VGPQTTPTNHVFICYARVDQEFVLKLARNLKERGVPVWVDVWDIPVSANWDQAIDDALYDCTQFLIVLSPAAVDSGEVRGELRTALDEAKPILPVLYQPCRIPRQLRLIQHADFTSRSPDDETALAQVIHALSASSASSPGPTRPGPASQAPPEEKPFVSPHQTLEPAMVTIPAGEFTMGSDEHDTQRPSHPVYLPEYRIGRYPVQNFEYRAYVLDTGASPPPHWHGDACPEELQAHPVVFVSWHDALAYCRWLGQRTRKPYRLPAEAEWEKAARGNQGYVWPWGETWDPNRCNSEDGGPGHTTPVGDYSPHGDSPFGVADVAGNVWEWCSSLHQPYPYQPGGSREDLDAHGDRVLRGGSFLNDHRFVHCTYRYKRLPTSHDATIGFRVALGPKT
jgi:formylglycine-generating enzyme required for sulfatase activity